MCLINPQDSSHVRIQEQGRELWQFHVFMCQGKLLFLFHKITD
jgi:hypothetical protein